MKPRQILFVIVSVGVLAGCSATPAAPVQTPEAISAATTCDTIADVLTIVYNADISFRQERTSQQEHNGAMILASRVLARIQVESGSELEEPVRHVQAAAPLAQTGAIGTFDWNSAQWVDALDDVSQACLAAGSEVGVSAWTGG